MEIDGDILNIYIYLLTYYLKILTFTVKQVMSDWIVTCHAQWNVLKDTDYIS